LPDLETQALETVQPDRDTPDPSHKAIAETTLSFVNDVIASAENHGIKLDSKTKQYLLVSIILQMTKEHDTNTETMGVNAQQIIEQALAAGQQLTETSNHPAPDAGAELETVVADATHLHDVLSELRERDMPLSAAEAEFAIGGLQELATRGLITARQLGLHAVERGLLSQNKLAGLLGVSQMTVSRWYREGLDETPHVDRRSLSTRQQK
jgi:hypothetical protein